MSKNTRKRLLKIYQDRHGKELFIDWLESIRDITTRARIKNRLRRIELGNMGDCEPIGKGVFELRLHFGPGYRVYFGEVDDVIIILFCGGDKRSQRKDASRAQEYWIDYKES